MTDTAVTSEFLTSALIVSFQIEAEEFGDWQLEPANGLMQRTGTLGVRVLEVLKGELEQQAEEVVELAIVERGTGGPRVMDYYGLWAHVRATVGASLVAFCDNASTDLRLALAEEHCDQLVDARTVLDDLHLVLDLHERHLTATAVIGEAARLRGVGRALFARYVWARTRDAMVGSIERFSALMRIAEDPETRIEAQETYLLAAYEDATFTGSFAPELRARLARSMFRTVLDPATGELRDHLLGTFIPNLVQAASPERLSVRDVFADQVDLEDQVRSDEADRNTSTYTENLRAWLATESEG